MSSLINPVCDMINPRTSHNTYFVPWRTQRNGSSRSYSWARNNNASPVILTFQCGTGMS